MYLFSNCSVTLKEMRHNSIVYHEENGGNPYISTTKREQLFDGSILTRNQLSTGGAFVQLLYSYISLWCGDIQTLPGTSECYLFWCLFFMPVGTFLPIKDVEWTHNSVSYTLQGMSEQKVCCQSIRIQRQNRRGIIMRNGAKRDL